MVRTFSKKQEKQILKVKRFSSKPVAFIISYDDENKECFDDEDFEAMTKKYCKKYNVPITDAEMNEFFEKLNEPKGGLGRKNSISIKLSTGKSLSIYYNQAMWGQSDMCVGMKRLDK